MTAHGKIGAVSEALGAAFVHRSNILSRARRAPRIVAVGLLSAGISGLILARQALRGDRGEELNRHQGDEAGGQAGGMLSGHFTPETLPPLSQKARAIIEAVDAVAPLEPEGESVARNGAGKRSHTMLTDDVGARLKLEDRGHSGVFYKP